MAARMGVLPRCMDRTDQPPPVTPVGAHSLNRLKESSNRSAVRNHQNRERALARLRDERVATAGNRIRDAVNGIRHTTSNRAS